MSLNIGDALSTAAEKLTTTAGLQLGGLYVLAVLLTTVGSNSIAAAASPQISESSQIGLALPVGAAGGGVLLALGVILGLVLTVVVLRTVDHDASELDSIPDGAADNLAKTIVFLLVAGIIQGILVAIGFIFLVIPGLFVLVSLYFAQVYIAVEGEGPLEGLSSSWGLAKGNRLSIFGLVLVVGVISFLGALVGQAVATASPAAGSLVSAAVSGFLSVFTTAALVDAYHQLTASQAKKEDLLEQPE
jgi:hypothetical protein